jgi:hypothetical protein
MGRSPRRRTVPVVLVAILAAAGAARGEGSAVGLPATGPSSGPASGPAVADRLTAVGTYDRHARVTGRVQVALANRGPAPVEVVRFQVRHPMFATVPAEDRESVLRPGATAVRPLPFGAPRCDVTDDSGAVVVLGVRGGDGSAATVTEVTVPLAEGGPGLAAWHATACAAAAVGDVVEFELGPALAVEDGGARLRTSLRAERTGPGEITVTGVGNSILFSVAPASGDPVLALPAAVDTAATEVVLTVARCDVHALIESKTSFTFPLQVAIGDADPVPVPVTAGDDVRAAMQEMLETGCDLGG